MKSKHIEEIRNALSNIWEFSLSGTHAQLTREISYIRKILYKIEGVEEGDSVNYNKVDRLGKDGEVIVIDGDLYYKVEMPRAATGEELQNLNLPINSVGPPLRYTVPFAEEDKERIRELQGKERPTIMEESLAELSKDLSTLIKLWNNLPDVLKEANDEFHTTAKRLSYHLSQSTINDYCERRIEENTGKVINRKLGEFAERHETVLEIDFYKKLGDKLDRIQNGTLDLKDYINRIKDKRIELIKNLK